MQLICPCCQSVYPIEAAINDVNARNAIKRAFSLTPIGELLLAYVQLFRPPSRVLSMSKLTRLLDQMVDMIKSGRIERNGRTWPAPQTYWQQGIEHMLATRDQLSLPLKSHGYLLTIIATLSEKAESRQEAHAEARKAAGTSHDNTPQPAPKGMPEEVRGQIKEFLHKSTGK